jgi:hypothetical protein
LIGGVGGYAAVLNTAQAAWNSVGYTGSLVVFDTVCSCVTDPQSTTQYTITPNALPAGSAFADYATALSLVAPQFVILLPQVSVEAEAFFVQDSFIGNNTFLINAGTIHTISPSSLPASFVNAVNSRRSFGTYPIYAQVLA